MSLATFALALALAAPPAALRDLPLIEVPSMRPGARMVLLLTGDGGWAAMDQTLASTFAGEGVPVVGLDSLRYFWKRRAPDEVGRDVGRILASYAGAWGRPEVILVGYSRGADVAAVIGDFIPPAARKRLQLVALLGPSTFAELEVHVVDLFTSKKRRSAISTEAAVRATRGATPLLCVQGDEERDSLCPLLADLPWVQRIRLHGGHHFDGRYPELARRVLEVAGYRPPSGVR